jgi:two-component system, NarL family, sensor histidine kinase UhpB
MLESQAHDPAAVDALLAVASAGAPLSDQPAHLDGLLRAMAVALDAPVAALQTIDERNGRFALAASLGLPMGGAELAGAPLAAGLAGRTLVEGRELTLPDDGPIHLLPRALVVRGMRHAVALPVRASGRAMGVAWAASPEPMPGDGLRRRASRVAIERIAVALEHFRLQETLERAMAQILQSDERMLGRIGLDIHDGPTQQLSVALLEVQLLQADLDDAEAAGESLPERLRPAVERIYETVGGALHEMRELIGHLRPAQFENRRLPEILQDAVTAFEARSGSLVHHVVDGEFHDELVSISQKITFYRILQEALTNAHRHGRATEVTVRLRDDEAGITLDVRDNGVGFDPDQVQRPRPGTPQPRFGLYGMRDRAGLLQGTFDVASRPGAGTSVRVFLPRWRRTVPAAPVEVVAE